jgi:UDP-glucose 4-epimerase
MGKRLLITGGTGSFGQAVLNRFIHSEEYSEIRIFSRDEKKQDDLRKKINHPKVTFYIGDVRDERSVADAMLNIDYVFHAAALKQVPSCEFFPMEAVKTNILGTENVLNAAIQAKVKKVVLSTDKAAYPINAMGMSKALMEKVMIAKSRNLTESQTVLCGTRYGNVMASRGSVIPLFIDQMKSGHPLTITNPQMTRFMMTLEDAVDLVLFAFENAKQGDLFIQKSPACTIETLAQAMLSLYGSRVGIKLIGTRHGEKLFETLVNKEDMVVAEDLGKYYRIPADSRDLRYDDYFSTGNEKIDNVEEYNSHNTIQLDLEETKSLLMKLTEVAADVTKI